MFRVGAVDPVKFAESQRTGAALPSLHSSKFAPLPEPAIKTGVTALTAAALDLLAKKYSHHATPPKLPFLNSSALSTHNFLHARQIFSTAQLFLSRPAWCRALHNRLSRTLRHTGAQKPRPPD
jgi:hypothetical protein